MSLNNKRLAKLICNMLMDGYPQHKELADAEFLRLNSFCAERSNNIAMAMPELLAECTDETQSYEDAVNRAALCADAPIGRLTGTSIVGVEAGESL